MLKKRNNFMNTDAVSVKKIGRLALFALISSTAAIAPSAFASDSPLVDRVITVKFQVADLDAEDGVEKVYAKLRKRAKSSCRSDMPALYYLNQRVSECTADLLDQFVTSAKIEKLQAYHDAKTTPVETLQLAFKDN